MIYEEITVQWYENSVRERGLDYDLFVDKSASIYDRFTTFTKFTNKGKVSKTQKHNFGFVNEEAERLLAERLEIKAQAEEDEKRAIELAKIVDKAFEGREDAEDIDFDEVAEGKSFDSSFTPGWATIKIKESHSSWYSSHEEYGRSLYLTQVPVEVMKEAKELQAIRRKHQGDGCFNFDTTWYSRRIVRVADHPNWNF